MSLDPKVYGGEAVMGSISKEAYDYWTKNPAETLMHTWLNIEIVIL